MIMVPYKARDLEGLALVGYHLEMRYGHEVIYSNSYGIEHKLFKYGPDALVMDHLMWDFKAHQARVAKGFGMKLVVLPTEGLHHEMEEASQRAGKLTRVADIVDCHFVWGDLVRDAILDDNLA